MTTHRIFKPVILFHDHSYLSDPSGVTHRIHIPYGDPHYIPLIQKKKQKVGLMLKSNGQVWSEFIESTRRKTSLKSPHLSPSSSMSSPKPSCHTSPHSPKTPPQHRDPSLDKRDTTDSKRRTRLLLQQYGPDRYHHHYHNPYEHPTSAFLPSVHKREEEWPISREENDDEEEEEYEEEDSDSNTTSMNSSSSPIPTVRKRRGNLPKSVTAVLKQWLIDHCRNPYPTELEKTGLRDKTGLTLNQISNWFINARRRLLPQILDNVHPYASSQNEIPVTLNKEDQDNNQPFTKRRKRSKATQPNSTYTLSTSNTQQQQHSPSEAPSVKRRRRYTKRSSAAVGTVS